ncbi:hypothetical protein KU6B_11280 [Mameliella alba]|nr:hypothetical protein KU6B_11280 [Mameliella alba]
MVDWTPDAVILSTNVCHYNIALDHWAGSGAASRSAQQPGLHMVASRRKAPWCAPQTVENGWDASAVTVSAGLPVAKNRPRPAHPHQLSVQNIRTPRTADLDPPQMLRDASKVRSGGAAPQHLKASEMAVVGRN